MITRNYFAAANGYTGFRSYFGDTFASKNYKRIFILKGGPGTGKSTLMKHICEQAANEGADHDRIYCSSDPSSLDGVIVHLKNGDYAIIDGTAPHERDAVIPGAIDTLVNVGDALDAKLLSEQRDAILKLNAEKADAYKNAYTMLRSAGAISQRIDDIVRSHFSYKTARALADSLFSGIKSSDVAEQRIALRQAFCKDGKYNIAHYSTAENGIPIHGMHGEENEFLNILRDISRQNVSMLSYTPLNSSACDGITVNGCFFFTTGLKTKNAIDAGELLYDVPTEELAALESTKDSLLEQAQSYFARASASHFKLEAIYSGAMRFEQNELLLKQIIKEIF